LFNFRDILGISPTIDIDQNDQEIQITEDILQHPTMLITHDQ